MKELINHKFNEELYVTPDPQLMYNRFFAQNVYRKYTEDFLDDETGEVVSVERRELLFERGAHINGDVIAKIRFYLSTGDIKEVAISNQCRRGLYELSNYCRPYIAKVAVGGKKFKVLLYASSLQNVIDVVRDFGELTFARTFDIVTAKEIDYAEIHLDTLKPIDLTEEYLKDKISMREWAAAEKSIKPSDENKGSLNYWRLDLSITEMSDGHSEVSDNSFIIKTTSVERALAFIEVLLYKRQEEAIAKGGKAERASYSLKIISAQPLKIDYVVPKELSEAHNKQE